MSKSKFMKRVISTLLIGILATVSVNAKTIDDKIPPMISNVEAEFNYDKLGVEIIVEASDEGSGLSEVAVMTYLTNNNKENNIELKLVNGKYIGFLPINKNSESMSISFIAIGDKGNNVVIQYNKNVHNILGNDLSNGNIDSESFTKDELPPTLKGIDVELDYNKIEVRIDAEDDGSGLFKEAYAVYNVENGSYTHEKKLILELKDGKYVGTMNTSEVEGSGKLSYIVLVDRYDNSMIVYNSKVHEVLGQDLSDGNFNTKILVNDTIAPVFKNIDIQVDEEIAYISVQAKDALSGLGEEAIVSYVFESEIDGKLEYEERKILLKLNGDRYVGELDLSDVSAVGKLNYLTLWDSNKNVKIVYNSEVHELLGINTNFAEISRYGTKIKLENISSEQSFKLGENAEINIKVSNPTNEDRKLKAKFILYDINNTMVQSKESAIEIGTLGSKNIKEVLDIPEEGYYKIKVILLDAESGRVVCDPIDIDVQ